jgi:sulfite exporter TauE/SafE
MKCNVGKTDRMFRFMLGIVIIAAGLYYQSWWGVIGIIPLLTGALRWCPPYLLLGINTDKK